MKVLITGGAGYLGYTLSRELHKRTDVAQIFIYDNLSKLNNNFFYGREKLNKFTFIQGDILDYDKLSKAINGIEIVYHLAAKVSFPFNHEQNLQYEQINTWGTANLYRCLENSDVKTVVYTSSSAVYGFNSVLDESVEPAPENNYGVSKFAGEKYLQLLENKGKKVFIARCANVFGFNESLRLDSVINRFIFDTIVDNKVSIFGNGEQKRPFISLLQAIYTLIDLPFSGYKSGIYNVVEFNASINEICNILQSAKPSVEYIRVNRNLRLESIEMDSMRIPACGISENIIRKAFNDFSQNIVF